jgi:hypothetical protein
MTTANKRIRPTYVKTPKHRLSYVDNWGQDEYYIGGVYVTDIRKVAIKGKVYNVVGRDKSVVVDDMGHSYTMWSIHFYVTETVFGIKQDFDLNTLMRKKVPVFATDYTIRTQVK